MVYDTIAQDVNIGDPVPLMTVKLTKSRNKTPIGYVGIIEGAEIKKRKEYPSTDISEPTITEKDYRDIDFAIKHNVEWLALSVRSADDIKHLRS